MPLGEHLRTDKDIDLARRDGIAHDDERSPLSRAVAIDAQHARARKKLDKRTLEPLRAEA
jgi:hypothetical protein